MVRCVFALWVLAINFASGAVLSHSSGLRTGSIVSASAHSLRQEPKGKEEDLSKKMPLKAQEQGFEGKKVKHADGKTGTDDWQKEYGHEKPASPAPVKEQKSDGVRCTILSAMIVLSMQFLSGN
mmetsp:Transcript_81788/g.128786  ORF Transcript_81788/g.128786 Transcript_81788/m.128786 type:complete len:124 (+) Transcript_81788:72-443(+)|eukprot:CAMPEP_0169110484 /NCGR_PEP_ID=MMETSP1015-20121227/26537_1 /TAXON_ID=342587 /ORGANISM="Karlodinium micrum, Strain CCMP2283" /LENGTH=123 /DNA_ID=CAMNT_0009172279 /DNA_START=69 /DNA_END=440 /DNA_ORIENTATION=-